MSRMIDAAEVYAKLTALGHNNNPEKQAYRGQIASAKSVVYDRNGNPSTVRADQVDHHIDAGGMTLTPPAALEPEAPEEAPELPEEEPVNGPAAPGTTPEGEPVGTDTSADAGGDE